MKPTLDALEQQLRRHNHRITQPRQLVFLAFTRTMTPMSAKDLLRQVPLTDRATIYRTVQLFLESEIIVEHSLKGRPFFALSEHFAEHQHFIVCDTCQKTTPLNSRELEKLLPKLAQKADYKITSHSLSLHGICSEHSWR
jgi:Fur family ferric uptake transcriptional regulator